MTLTPEKDGGNTFQLTASMVQTPWIFLLCILMGTIVALWILVYNALMVASQVCEALGTDANVPIGVDSANITAAPIFQAVIAAIQGFIMAAAEKYQEGMVTFVEDANKLVVAVPVPLGH